MKKSLIALSIAAILTTPALAFQISTPEADMRTAPLQITDPDGDVATLGKVDLFIDLAASHDDLEALKVRRAGLTLPDGRPYTAYGVHKYHRLIVIAAGPVRRVSVSSVKRKGEDRETLVLFHGENGTIVAPKPEDAAVFDMDFKRLPFTYRPLAPPGSTTIPVNVLVDVSRSMATHTQAVWNATQYFLVALPRFAQCKITLFNSTLRPITKNRSTCIDTYRAIFHTPMQASGSTALFKALETGFEKDTTPDGPPIITVALTDGVNTVPYEGGLETLKAKKDEAGDKLFVFWLGGYQRGYLEDLPDLEFVSKQNVSDELKRFFRSLGYSVSGLQSLLVSKG